MQQSGNPLQLFSDLTRQTLKTWASAALMSACLVGVAATTAWGQSNADRVLKVGVVQRFGEKPTDTLTLKATGGDRLTINYATVDGPATLTTDSIKLQVAERPLPVPLVDERVVLSTHRSFESAEASALEWQARGIETEVANPDRWQVWAKRDVYNTPLLRRLLLQSLQAQGDTTTHIQTRVLRQMPQAYWILNGYRYNRHQLEVTSGNNVIQVQEGDRANNSRLYGGRLRLQLNAYGSYTLVNDVPLETYLRGVVPHEIGISAPPTAIEAQAILARTYALRNLRRFTIDNYEICASTDCQVYKGLTEVFAVSDRAISATRGEVLTYNNELVDALYSSNAGGVTAPFNDVWDGPERPYLRAVVDSVANSWDLSSRPLQNEQNFRAFMNLKKGFNEDDWELFRWREEATLQGIAEFLQKFLQRRNHPMAKMKTVQQVRVTERSPAGRVLKMEVQTDVGVVEVFKDDIRNAFYPPISTLFYLDPIYNPDRSLKGYAFVGGGFGHGVGLSQSGSYRLGRLGWSSQQILNFYFPGTQVQPLNDSIVFWQNPSPVASQVAP
ncbi:SpoIID/LytB domain-containing protein [Desertifilum sp. FACHB-1129]|uniref:Amidase n=1 Tax=Desertifilum tharense IPPAS B-1220 TaxID=1781255 RepID=A0A1E5QNV3_9CYAN|nr:MULTISPECIES: SpoIID/LytB domain-containing protein [Desertifilum]MDA0212256.1 SpoIID/LytB domain-containing protein [Cyanobacteria bacterium FC1]MBD2312836.1 SpoIID/LytB domain-containing protein [Desertifilum sp. FACHB-1129]MBD2324200.1 SpoIID/LytB domain-containing protein [Desertifilum sp. FACHB-866]MBD2334214.1 SpoIID/LytB domain-containing protein [Desertifilum sp. FACHB-868]OEJ76277.1 amidase [Desertifilum tharense IPPAS B-1220]